ncbi:MAG TPA: GAF domain-containing protein [bacterium]|nr:GAF domain-containing protein [bacterium]
MKPTRTSGTRAAAYSEVLDRIRLLLEGETDWVAAMATIVCELRQGLDHYDWVGFYRAVGDDLLVIGPYQGTHGCLRIELGRGVCGTAAAERRTVIVDDVHEFPGHIACDAASLSEIVVPVLRPDGSVLAVLDVDSNRRSDFGEDDRAGLEELCAWLGERFGDG